MESVTLTAAVIAVIKAVKEYVPQVTGIYTLILAIILGGAAGYLQIDGLSVTQGVVIGVSAVGVVTTADRIGTKS